MTAAALWRLLRPYLPGLILLLAIGVQTWRVDRLRHQRDDARGQVAAMNARTQAAATRIAAAARRLASGAQIITKGKNDEIARIAADRDALLEQLRSRPTRAAATAAAPAADGSAPRFGTGAALFADDAQFLVREAARADNIRVSLIACYAQYDQARQALEELRDDPSIRDIAGSNVAQPDPAQLDRASAVVGQLPP